MAKHWTDNDFLMALYGVGPQDGHLDSCEACRAEWQRRQQARRDVLGDPQVPADFLVTQRQRIDSRLERRPMPWMMRWSPALGVSAMALALLIWQGPLSKPVAPHSQPVAVAQTATSDAQLMAEIYQTAYDLEPGAVTPVKALFEARQ